MSDLFESTTGRGFGKTVFTDANRQECSIQESSALDFSHCDGLCEEEAEGCYSRPMLWLGVNDAEPKILARDAIQMGLPNHGQTTGWVPYAIPKEVALSTRMHLRVEHVKQIRDMLTAWLVEEGFE